MMPAECKEPPAWQRVALAALLLAATATSSANGLPGRIWSPPHASFVGEPVVRAAVARADFVILGETHTSARHHRLQARLLGLAAGGERRPAVVFEMIRADQQVAIDAWRRAGADPAAFGSAVGWEERGWPDWRIYQPIVETAVAHGLALHGGAPAPEMLKAVAEGGLEALAPAVRARLGLDRRLPATARQRLEDTLVAAHCGVSAHAPLERMLALQRLRDAAMAARVLQVGDDGGTVLITGNGHARRDHGVPRYLEAKAGGRRIVSVAFMAAGGGRSLDEQRALAGGGLPFDYVWFTGGEPPVVDCPAEAAAPGAAPS